MNEAAGIAIAVAIAFLSFAAPITAAILTRERKPSYSERELDRIFNEYEQRFEALEAQVKELY